MRKARFAIAAISATLLIAAPAVATTAKGNRRGVALALKVQRAYRHVPAVSYTETGFVSMYALLGRESVFDWHWGGGAVPPNWVKATEHITIGMHKGLVASVRNDLTPPPCHTFCIQQPVEIVQDEAGAFYAYGPFRKSKLKRTCFSHLSGSLPNIVGKPFEVAFASFAAPVGHGKTVVLRSHYMWGNAHATETEVISVRTSLPQRFVVDVGRGSEGSAPFTFKGRLHYPARAPKLPHINLCG